MNHPRTYLPAELVKTIRKSEWQTLLNLSGDRKRLFWLLARITLSADQAYVLFNPEVRSQCGILLSDLQIIENPYIIYEGTVGCPDELRIAVKKIDMAVFPPDEIRNAEPLPEPSAIESGNDKRRIRAYAISQLEEQANQGHTVFPQESLISRINSLPIAPACQVTGDVIDSIKSFLMEELFPVECKDGATAYQLKRLHDMDEVIRVSHQQSV
jgi:hypothetical protein